MIIDIHAHTSAHTLWNLHAKSATISDLHQLANEFNISKIYLMATYFPLKKSGLHNLSLLERIVDDELFGCFGSLNLEEENLAPAISELRYMAKYRFIEGIKLYPGYQNVVLSDSRFDLVYHLAEEFSLPVAVHLGELHFCCTEEMRNKKDFRCDRQKCELDERGFLSTPMQLARAAEKFPGVKFVACHLANPFFEEMREVMKNHPNIYTDISGQFYSGSKEDTPQYRAIIVEEIKKFLALPGGMRRVLFATDFPIQSYQDSLNLVESLNLKPAEKEMLLSGNALRLFPQKGRSK